MSWVDEYKKALGDIQTRTGTGSGSSSKSNSSSSSESSSSSWVNEYRNALNKYNSGITYYRTTGNKPRQAFGSLAPTYASYKPTSQITSRMTVGKKKEDDDDKKWYEKGHFEDGWDWGDLTKTILGIEEDTASLKDLTVNSFKRGYYNSRYGEESFKAMNGGKNQKEAYEKILAEDDYQFTPGSGVASGVSGMMEQFGQLYRQATHPRTATAVMGAAGIAAVAGQAGPQVLLPEEVITVPAAATAAFTAASAASNLEIEAGHAYNEMLENGISEETARKVAWGVGGINASLELLQVDELLDAYKVTKNSGLTENFTKKLVKELVDRGVDVAKETSQEVGQEFVTTTGVQMASMLDKGEWAYTGAEVRGRLKDTAKSSALTFGTMNVPAAAKNTYSIIKDNKNVPVNQTVQNDHPIVEQKAEPEIKPEVEEVKPVVEQTEVKPPEKKVLYTGSPNTDIKQFKVGGVDGSKQTGDRYGRGIYLTTNESTAKNYAGDKGRVYQINADDLNIFDLNETITPEMRDSLIKAFNCGDKQFRNSMLRNFRTEMTFDDFESAKAFFDQQRKVWKEQDGEYTANKPEILEADNETGRAVIEFTDFENWENKIGTLTGNHLYDALKSLSTDDFSSFITGHGFDGIAFDEDSENQQYVIYRNEDRLHIDDDVAKNATTGDVDHVLVGEPYYPGERSTVAENATVPTTDDFSAPEVAEETTTPVSERSNPHFDRMIAERDSLQKTLWDRYNKQLFDEETERLANEFNKLNSKIESMKASQSSVESAFSTHPVESEPAIPPVVEDSISSAENIEASSVPEQAITEPVFEEATQEAEKPKTTAEKARDYYRNGLLSFDRVFPNEEKTPEKVARFESLKDATKAAQNFIANGADGVKPVADIFRKVSEDGTYGDFELYLRHLLNIDRTTRNERFGKEDMPVFGEEEWKDGKRIVKWFTTAEQSREKVAEFEKAHPEFIQNREDVYAFFDHLKQMLVDSGRITQETADRWAEIDPHYIAISRGRHEQVSDKLFRFLNSGFGEYTFKEDGFAEFEKDIITAEPLYSIRATGEDFHSLIDTMVDRALRTFWTVADIQYEEASQVAPVQSEADVTTDAPIDPSVETNSDTEITQEEFDSLNELGQNLVEEESLKEETPIDPSVETNEETDTTFEDDLDEDLDADDDLESDSDEDVEIEQSPERRDDLLHDRLGLMGFLDIYVLDEGLRFEIMSKKEGNSLDAFWHAIGNSFSSAQHFIGNGNPVWGIESVKSVVDKVTTKKLHKTFNTFLIHLRNIDNMTLKSRYVVAPNDYSIGLPLHESYNAVRNIKAQNPEVAEIALGLYENADYIRNQFVEHNMLSEGQAELWQELFPNWLPFRRDNANYRKFMDGVKNLREYNIISPTTATKMQEFFLKNIPHAEQGGKARPMLETMAQYTTEAHNAWAMNDFALELKNTLHSEIKREDVDIREFIKRLDSGVGLIDLEKKKNTYTCTCYENGEKVTFKIDKEMYLALNNTKSWMDWKIPVLHQVNEGFRKFCTEWNIFFATRNAPKDLQEVLYNSQHPMETYCELINAANEIANNGVFYQEYLANGGESITYFDPKKFSFNSSTDVLEVCKLVSGIKTVETVNNRVETLPRFAEFIASRKMGRSVQEAMLDSARVTVNFQAGGKFTKFLNRNGCTFLNASFQGALQHVRNFANAATDADGKIRFDSKEAKLNVVKGIVGTAAKGLAYGLSTIAINDLFWGDDEEYEEQPDYVREGYYIIAKLGEGRFIRIPKGRTNEAIEEGIRTVGAASSGDDEADWKHFFDVVIETIAPNNPLSKNIFAPIIEVAKGETWYGEEMTPYRLKDEDTVEQFTEKTDIHSVEWSKMLEESNFDEWLAGTYDLPIIGNWIKNSGFADGLSPIEINYLINSYTGVLGDTVLPYFTPKAESPYDDPLSKSLAPLRDIFTTDTVLNNKVTDDFYDTMEAIEAQAMSEDATLEDKFKNSLMIGYNADASKLYEEQRNIQMDENLSDSEKYERTREIKKEINALLEKGLAALEDYSIDGIYAEAGDKRYNYGYDTENEVERWFEVKPKTKEGEDNWYYTQEQLYHDNLGVSYADFWNKRYDPENLDVKSLYDERNGKRYNFGYDDENDEHRWFEITPKKSNGEDNYYYYQEQRITKDLGISYDEYWNNREMYDDFYYIAGGYDKDSTADDTIETAKTIFGYERFAEIAKGLKEIKADKDKNGESISGTKYPKVQAYVNSLDIPDIEKKILYTMQYPNYKKYKREIVKYLDKNNDISYSSYEKILDELGYKIDSKGYVTW